MEETTQANTDVCRQCGERPKEKTKNGYIRPLCSSCHNKQRSPESIKRNREKNALKRTASRQQSLFKKHHHKCLQLQCCPCPCHKDVAYAQRIPE